MEPTSINCLEFYYNNLQVTAFGGTGTVDIFSLPGGRGFHIADPDGNVLAV